MWSFHYLFRNGDGDHQDVENDADQTGNPEPFTLRGYEAEDNSENDTAQASKGPNDAGHHTLHSRIQRIRIAVQEYNHVLNSHYCTSCSEGREQSLHRSPIRRK